MKYLKYLLILICVQGLAVNVWFLQTRSESENAVVFGLSAYRLALFAVQMGLFLLSVGVTVWLWRSPKRGEAILRTLDTWCLDNKQIGVTVTAVGWFTALMLAGYALVFGIPGLEKLDNAIASVSSPVFVLVLSRVQPLYVWFLALLIEGLLFLIIRYHRSLQQRDMWNWRRISVVLIGLLILTSTLVHWLILGLKLGVFVNHPAWYWTITSKPVTVRDLLFAITGITLLGFACWLLVWRCRVRAGLMVVFITGCLLQYGIGYLEGGGLRSLQDRYFSSYHRSYVNKASQDNMPVVEMVRNYENVYGNRMFTSTKPPGLMAFTIGLDRLINGSPSPYTAEDRFNRLAWAITWAFPIAAMVLVFVLYGFARRFLPSQHGLVGLIAPVMLITCPNILLLGLFADQAIYPTLFLTGAWLVIETIRRQALLGAFLLGVFLYLAIFFAFTMLPLFPLAGLYLLIHYLIHRDKLRFTHQVMMGLMMATGVISLYLIFRGYLNYDFFTRFATTVSINHNFDFYERVGLALPVGPEPFGVRVQQTIAAAWINNLEFATAVGFPLYILFVVQAVRLAGRMIRRAILPADSVLMAFLLTFVVLNLAGTAQGEVGRLWMFWLPMVLLFAAFEIEKWVKQRPIVLFAVLLLQFGTVLLTYHFQDLVM